MTEPRPPAAMGPEAPSPDRTVSGPDASGPNASGLGSTAPEVDTAAWAEANKRALLDALAPVRAALDAARTGDAAARPPGGDGAPTTRPEQGALPDDDPPDNGPSEGAMSGSAAPSTLATLCATFDLSPFERDVLVLCAGCELDAGFAAACASAQRARDADTTAPTFGLALALLRGPHWSALLPDGPLRHWRLVEVGAGETLAASPLRLDERVLHHLVGLRSQDPHLAGFVDPLAAPGTPPEVPLTPSHEDVARALTDAYGASGQPAPVLQMVGSDGASQRVVATHVAARLGVPLSLLVPTAIPTAPHERDVLRRLCDREAALSGTLLLLDLHDADRDTRRAAARWLAAGRAPVLVAAPERLDVPQRPGPIAEVAALTTEERRALWRLALGTHAYDTPPTPDQATDALGAVLDLLATHFALNAPTIWATARQARAQGPPPTDAAGAEALARRLWQQCRAQARPRLDGLAERRTSAVTWDDLVLPEAQMETLRDLFRHVRHRRTVFERWGFGHKTPRGLGLSALFAGPSGTGKTLAADVLARALGLDLYHIDLSRVVSKYIGETEKNLGRIFDAAEGGGAVLLFDEADALFGKRTEVKDSHDRYANIEVSYLLQRMESYRGLAILTTNLKGALDEAFLRRLRFIVPFPFPDATARAAIWRRAFPPATPTEDLDAERLAQLNVTGGVIRNIALAAAFLAADEGAPVRMAHVRQAARREYAKLERPLSSAELRGWS